MCLFNYVLLIGVVTGIIASLPRIGWRTLKYLAQAIGGAMLGAMLAMGDVPLLMKYSVLLNEKTIPVAAAIVFVLIGLFVERKYKRDRS